jgi:SP family galactose:H+ symporter-like MFS transporter
VLLAGPGLAFTFSVFAVICLGGIAFTLLRVPETTGYSLEAIEKHLNSGKPLAALRREVAVSVAVVAPLK